MRAEPRKVRSTLSGRRLLIGLVLVLLVPGAPGWLHSPTGRPSRLRPRPPCDTRRCRRHRTVSALAQLERSAAATRLARRLTAPQLLTPAGTDTGAPVGLPTLALAPRATPYTLAELRRIAPAAFSEVPAVPGALLLGAHLEVPVGATLVINARTPDVRLPSDPSGFATIISRGTTTVTGTAQTPVRISSWDTARRGPDGTASDGRSFVLQIGGRMDVDHGRFEYLGFGTGTSSGVAWRGAAPDVAGTAPERRLDQGAGHRHRLGVRPQPLRRLHPRGAGHALVGQHLLRQRGVRLRPARLQRRLRRGEQHGPRQRQARVHLLPGLSAQRPARQHRLRQQRARLHDRRRPVDGERDRRGPHRPSNDNLVTGNVAYDNAGSGVEIEGGTATWWPTTTSHATTSGCASRMGHGHGHGQPDRRQRPLRGARARPGSPGGDRRQPHLRVVGGGEPRRGEQRDAGREPVERRVHSAGHRRGRQRDPSWIDRMGQFMRWNPCWCCGC